MTPRDEAFMQDAADTPLGELVALAPATSRVLLRHDLDFCCGGKQTLSAACGAKGLRVEHILSELHDVWDTPPLMDWSTAPLTQIITHILKVYHAPLGEELAQLTAMAEKVYVTHGIKEPVRLAKLRDHLREFAQELQFHMEKEEMVLFPWIATRRNPPPSPPIRMMEAEHHQAAQSLTQLRALTDDFTAPEGACMTWRNLYARLENFDHTLRAHIHLENHVLFPRALTAC